MIEDASNEGGATQGADGSQSSAPPVGAGCTPPVLNLKAALALPKGDVLLRKVKGPDGTNAWLGYVKVGRVYATSARHAARLIDCGEFEAVGEYAADVEAERATLAKVAEENG